jgi:hypothetical protein
VTITPGADHPQIGQPLQIRLIQVDDGGFGKELNFDDVRLEISSDPMNSSPYSGEYVHNGDVELSWTNQPANVGSDVWVDVWFGKGDPNSMSQVVSADPDGLNLTSHTVSASDPNTYYWQVNSYLEGTPTGEPVSGLLYVFYATPDIPPSATIVSGDMITWSGQPVPLDVTVEDDGVSPLTYEWSVSGAYDFSFDPNEFVEDPIVTLTNDLTKLPVINPGFEDPVLEDGFWNPTDERDVWEPGLYTLGAPDPTEWTSYGNIAGYLNPDNYYGYFGIAPGGQNIAYCESYSGYDQGLRQILSVNLEANLTYDLSALVGNPGGTPEYRIDLAAGGVIVASTNGNGPGQGDPAPDPNSWITASLTFSTTETDPNVGQPLEIRLVQVNNSGTVNFDDVRLHFDSEYFGPVPEPVTLTLAVGDEYNEPQEETIAIDVYSGPCYAAFGAGLDNPSDIDDDCDTDLEDFAAVAEDWLVDGRLTVPKIKESPPTPSANVFSLNFYYYSWAWTEDYQFHTITLNTNPEDGDQFAGIGDWLTDGWEDIEIPWEPEAPQDPITIVSNQGSEATYTLTHARNGGPYYWDDSRFTLLGDGNADMMDGHAHGTEDSDEQFDMTVSDIPFGRYDVIIYIGSAEANVGDGTGNIVFNGASQGFTLASSEFLDGTFTEIVDSVTPGNYIVYEDVTGDSFTLQMWGNGFNHLGPSGIQFGNTDAYDPSPADGAYAYPDSELELSWTNLEPNSPSDPPVYVDVWFGTDPNKPSATYDFNKIADAVENANSVTVNASVLRTYYWQVNSYMDGDPNVVDYFTSSEPNMIEGPVWNFQTVSDAPVSVNAGDDVVTWSGQAVQLDGTVVDDGASTVNLTWSAEPSDGVVFDPNEFAEDPIVTITKATDNPSGVLLTLSGQDAVSSDEDNMWIHVYDTACLAAIAEGAELEPGDFDEDCDVDIEDLRVTAEEWLDDYTLTGPVPKP